MASLQRVNQGTWHVHAGSVPLLQCYGQSLEHKVFVASIASHIRDPAILSISYYYYYYYYYYYAVRFTCKVSTKNNK